MSTTIGAPSPEDVRPPVPAQARWSKGPVTEPRSAGRGDDAAWFHGKPTGVDDVEIGRPVEPQTRPGPATRLVIALLGVYRRFVSPLFLPHCRFHPSCSAYAVEALQVHGLARGTGLALLRLLKCAPWHPGGLDPVPPRRSRDPDGVAVPEPDRESPGVGGPPADPTDRTAPRGAAAPISEEQASC